MRRLLKLLQQDTVLIFIAGLLVAIYLHWPALVDPYRFHHNWRQSPHWLSPHRQHFQPDDLLVRFAEFPIGPLGNFIYKTLALTGIDIFWGKVIGVTFFALTTLSVYIAGRAMRARAGGLVAAAIFLFFPCMFYEFSGGYTKALSCPLYAVTIWTIYRQRWWWSIALLVCGAVTYPMIAIHLGMIYLMDILLYDIHDRSLFKARMWKTKYLPLAIAALSAASLLGFRYLGANHEFGELVGRAEMQDRVEFTRMGRYYVYPTRALWEQITERIWDTYFHLTFFLFALFFMGRRALQLPRGLYGTLLGSMVLYWLADIFLLRLYVPDRYLLRSLPIFMALAGGYWWASVFYDQNKRWRGVRWTRLITRNAALIPITALLIGLGISEFDHRFKPGIRTRKFDRQGLYEAIRALPGKPMIAVHPRLGSDILLLTGRSVLVSKQLSLPWWPDYFEIISERTRDLFAAYYATKPQVLRRVIDKYDIDYWIVQPEYFQASYIRRNRIYKLDPFDRWIKRTLKPSNKALLYNIPKAYRLYQDRRSYVVSSADLIRWLEKSGNGNTDAGRSDEQQ